MRLPDRIWVPALAALALALVFAAALLVRAEGDASLLVRAAPPWTSSESAPGSLTVQDAEDGFDGQFFYRGGAAPLSTAEREVGVELDLPALRSSRIGYSALAFVGSGGGSPSALPWTLLGLNLAAAAAVGAAGGVLARRLGHHAAWGLLFALWPGFAYSLSLDTAELVASAAALWGLAAVGVRRWVPAVALLAFAALTRETALVYAGGVGLAGLLQLRQADADRSEARGRVIAAFAVVDLFVLWHIAIWLRFDEWAVGSSGGSNNLGPPLAGLVTELGRSLPPGGVDETYRLLAALAVLMLSGAAAWAWRGSAAPLEIRLAWVPAAIVVLLLNDYQWSGATAFLRATTEAGLLATAVVLGTPDRRLRALVGLGLGGLWLVSAVAQLSKVAA